MGWRRRESPGLRACKRESASVASSRLDEIRPCAAFAPAGAKSLRRQQACLLKPRLHPRVPRIRFSPLAITSKKYRPCGRHLFEVVEAAGISRSSRLQARIRSQARRMRREFPARPASRCFNSRKRRSKLKSHPKNGWHFNFGGGGGNRTRVQKHSTDSSTYLVLSFGFNLADADTHAAARRVTLI